MKRLIRPASRSPAARSRVVGITKRSPVARRPPHPDLSRSLVSSAVARRRSRSQETGRERTEQGTNGPFTVDTPISRECRTSSDSRRTDDDKRNRRVVTCWMVAAGRRRHARRRTTLRPVRAASITIDRGRSVTARVARVGSSHWRRDRHRLPETMFPSWAFPLIPSQASGPRMCSAFINVGVVLRTLADHQAFTLHAFCQAWRFQRGMVSPSIGVDRPRAGPRVRRGRTLSR